MLPENPGVSSIILCFFLLLKYYDLNTYMVKIIIFVPESLTCGVLQALFEFYEYLIF